MASTADEPAAVPEATAGAIGSLEADAGVVDAALESGADKPVEPKEQVALPEMSKGVVGCAMQPPRPQVAPLATEEEDEVEEIEREESRPQAVQILCKRGDEVVVIEEEDTTRELKRLESALTDVMRQIKVCTASVMFIFDVGDCSS